MMNSLNALVMTGSELTTEQLGDVDGGRLDVYIFHLEDGTTVIIRIYS